ALPGGAGGGGGVARKRAVGLRGDGPGVGGAAWWPLRRGLLWAGDLRARRRGRGAASRATARPLAPAQGRAPGPRAVTGGAGAGPAAVRALLCLVRAGAVFGYRRRRHRA